MKNRINNEINNAEDLLNFLEMLQGQMNYQKTKNNHRFNVKYSIGGSSRAYVPAYQRTSKINSKTWDGRDIRSN